MNLRFLRPLALGAAGLLFAPAALAQPIDVLIAYGGDAGFSPEGAGLDLRDKLQEGFSSDFGSVDVRDVVSSLPTLAELNAYDVVLTYAGFGIGGDLSAFGAVLDSYTDAGGDVVTAYGASYDPVNYGTFRAEQCVTGPFGGRNDLGDGPATLTSFDSGSPVFDGVTSVRVGLRTSGGNLFNSASVIGTLSDGDPAVVQCEAGGQTRVDLGFFIGSADGAYSRSNEFGWDPSTDVARLIRNTLLFVTGSTGGDDGGGEPPLVSGALDFGTCLPNLPLGRSACRVDATGTFNGEQGQRFTFFLRVTDGDGYSRIAKRGEVKPQPGQTINQSVKWKTVAADPSSFTLEMLVEPGAVAAPSAAAEVVGTLDFTKGATLRAAEALAAFPNPTADAATLRFAVAGQTEATLVVYDALGREVARPVDGAVSGVVEAAFDASGLPAGLYVARLTTARGTETVRLSVVR